MVHEEEIKLNEVIKRKTKKKKDEKNTTWPISRVRVRGVIKKFSAWTSSVQNNIKIVFATYSRKA